MNRVRPSVVFPPTPRVLFVSTIFIDMQVLITENKFKEVIFDSIKEFGTDRTINQVGGFENYCKVFKIEDPMDFLKSLPLMDVVQSEEIPHLTLFFYKKGDNVMVYNREYELIQISYNYILSVLEYEFELSYNQRLNVIKKWLGEVYNLRKFTDVIQLAIIPSRLT